MSRSYEDFDLELILAMNIAYLCGDLAGVELGPGGFKGWMERAMVSQQAQSDALLDVYEAVAKIALSKAEFELMFPHRAVRRRKVS